MNRTDFLKLCQINSVYPNTKRVSLNGVEYYPKELRIKFNKGTAQNIAVLVDCKQAMCVVNVDLVKVEECEENETM